jgi:hypothetical protein
MYEKSKMAFVLFRDKENEPSTADVVPLVVPFSRMLTPAKALPVDAS